MVASGDSLLDRCLLDYADYAIAPRHGELYRERVCGISWRSITVLQKCRGFMQRTKSWRMFMQYTGVYSQLKLHFQNR